VIKRFLALLLPVVVLFSACTPAANGSPSITTPENTSPAVETSSPSPGTVTPSPIHSSTGTQVRLWLSPGLPVGLTARLNLPTEIQLADNPDESDVRLEAGSGSLVSTWIYALAAPFPTLSDDVRLDELQKLWSDGIPIHQEVKQLLVAPSTAALFTSLWGDRSPAVNVLPAEKLLAAAWEKGNAWTILPFEELQPRWKTLAVDGQSPLRKEFDPGKYPLTVRFSLIGENEERTADISAAFGPRSASPLAPLTNRQAEKLTTVLLTGVTALVRGTAVMMEYEGMDYPARDIAPILRQADILHINNEVPFAKNCPMPYPWEGLVFCSQERYIQLMEEIGTDVVDLSGDHFADWGSEAMLFTLDLYRQRGWPVYGGGEDIDAAKQPAYFENNGNKIAFIGCNYKAIGYATASRTNPGAVHCDPKWLYPLIKKVKEEGYLPIVTFQHEEYYEYIARPKLQKDFRGAAQAGAIIVSGSQAHQPHALEFTSGALLHYGLGNLFFDQVGTSKDTGWATLDRHVIYDNRHIGTELITIVFIDLARSRLATFVERQDLLNTIFKAGGW
jgi:poly-gamma-glutamate synthesis protein (capsule biosynthesis protein)